MQALVNAVRKSDPQAVASLLHPKLMEILSVEELKEGLDRWKDRGHLSSYHRRGIVSQEDWRTYLERQQWSENDFRGCTVEEWVWVYDGTKENRSLGDVWLIRVERDWSIIMI